MKKTWSIATGVAGIISALDVVFKWFTNMEFWDKYFSLIVFITSASSLLISAMFSYFKKQKQHEHNRQTERRFLQFQQQYDGLFDANNQSLREKHLTAAFTDQEIDYLVRAGYVKVKSFHVF